MIYYSAILNIDWSVVFSMLLNDMEPSRYVGYVLLFLVGVIIHFTMDVDRSMRFHKNGPEKFNLKFAMLDNIKRGLGVGLLILMMIAFYKDINGQELTPFIAIVLGYNADSLVGHGSVRAKANKMFNKSKLNNNES